jgi:histidyl-tRNA synthetase
MDQPPSRTPRVQTPQRVRGTQDIFGEDQRRFAHVVDTFERVRRLYCFQRVEMPVFEATQVFARSLGETSDVVSKEMYTFPDRGEDLLTLRPEFTAGICRAYITEGWRQYAPLKLATSGPLFRYERPQKGRYRQFHQVDAEIIGADTPAADVELIVMADQLIRHELGVTGVTLNLNTLGDAATRESWRSALIEYFSEHLDALSDESRARLERNPMRILDSKDPRDKPIAAAAPRIDDFLTAEAQDFFGAVTAGLDAAGVPWSRNPNLVRGLDYYRHTAFEFITDRLGAQDAVGGGGRYDGLVEALGGPATPGVGWALGIERLAMLAELPPEQRPVIIVADEAGTENAARLGVAALRRAGIPAETVADGNLRKRFDKAVKQMPAQILALRSDGYQQRGFTAQKEELDRVRAVVAPVLVERT